MSETATGLLKIHDGEGGVLTYDLVGRCGYGIEPNLEAVRVWDKNHTWLVSKEDLISLKVPNRRPSPHR